LRKIKVPDLALDLKLAQDPELAPDSNLALDLEQALDPEPALDQDWIRLLEGNKSPRSVSGSGTSSESRNGSDSGTWFIIMP
jgi:hypothetical protein